MLNKFLRIVLIGIIWTIKVLIEVLLRFLRIVLIGIIWTVEPQPVPPIEEPKLDYEAMYNDIKVKYEALEKAYADKSSIINEIKKLVEGE